MDLSLLMLVLKSNNAVKTVNIFNCAIDKLRNNGLINRSKSIKNIVEKNVIHIFNLAIASFNKVFKNNVLRPKMTFNKI